jgi:hypothetical protein
MPAAKRTLLARQPRTCEAIFAASAVLAPAGMNAGNECQMNVQEMIAGPSKTGLVFCMPNTNNLDGAPWPL